MADWLDSVAALGKTAGDAYVASSAADAAHDRKKAEEAARDREKQKLTTDTQRNVWLWLGVAGAAAVLLIVVMSFRKKA